MVTSTVEEPAKITGIKRGGVIENGRSIDEAEISFASERMVEYVKNRFDIGSGIFFGSKCSGGAVRKYANWLGQRRSDQNRHMMLLVEATGER